MADFALFELRTVGWAVRSCCERPRRDENVRLYVACDATLNWFFGAWAFWYVTLCGVFCCELLRTFTAFEKYFCFFVVGLDMMFSVVYVQ